MEMQIGNGSFRDVTFKISCCTLIRRWKLSGYVFHFHLFGFVVGFSGCLIDPMKIQMWCAMIPQTMSLMQSSQNLECNYTDGISIRLAFWRMPSMTILMPIIPTNLKNLKIFVRLFPWKRYVLNLKILQSTHFLNGLPDCMHASVTCVEEGLLVSYYSQHL